MPPIFPRGNCRRFTIRQYSWETLKNAWAWCLLWLKDLCLWLGKCVMSLCWSIQKNTSHGQPSTFSKKCVLIFHYFGKQHQEPLSVVGLFFLLDNFSSVCSLPNFHNSQSGKKKLGGSYRLQKGEQNNERKVIREHILAPL